MGLKNIELTIEEKITGEIMAGAGYGSDGSTFSWNKNNFMERYYFRVKFV